MSEQESPDEISFSSVWITYFTVFVEHIDFTRQLLWIDYRHDNVIQRGPWRNPVAEVKWMNKGGGLTDMVQQ